MWRPFDTEWMVVFVLLFALLGCDGGGDFDDNTDDTATETQVTILDGYIANAIVSDSGDRGASYKGDGVYSFAKPPVGQIHVR